MVLVLVLVVLVLVLVVLLLVLLLVVGVVAAVVVGRLRRCCGARVSARVLLVSIYGHVHAQHRRHHAQRGAFARVWGWACR